MFTVFFGPHSASHIARLLFAASLSLSILSCQSPQGSDSPGTTPGYSAIVDPTPAPDSQANALPEINRGPAELARRIDRVLDDGQVTASVVVYDTVTGTTYQYQPERQYYSGSLVKVPLMAALLDQAAKQGRALSSYEEALLRDMIQVSDNDAATALERHIGGLEALQAYLREIGLTETITDSYYWGNTIMTAPDSAKLMQLIATHRILTPELADYALTLMEHVAEEQRWGIPEALSNTPGIALKNAWFLEVDRRYVTEPTWYVHSVAAVKTAGGSTVIAILTTYSGELSLEYGQHTIRELTEAIAPLVGLDARRIVAPED